MLTILLLAQIAATAPSPATAARATPAATPAQAQGTRPAPSAASIGLPTSLSDYARDRRLKRTGTSTGTVSVSGGTGASGGGALAPSPLVEDERQAAKAAQERMDRAAAEGRSVDENVGAGSSFRTAARSEWDAAAEGCRKTPGCIPSYRSDGATKALKTDHELLEDLARKTGLSGVPRPDR